MPVGELGGNNVISWKLLVPKLWIGNFNYFICILYVLIIIIFRLKDSDVTWLYGPLHTAVDPVPQPKASTLEDHIDLDKGSGTKPILKHRTISELLTLPSNSSPTSEAIPDDYSSDVPSEISRTSSPDSNQVKRPKFHPSHSEPLIKTAILNSEGANNNQVFTNDQLDSSQSSIYNSSSKNMTPNLSNSDGDISVSSGSKRHITFNNFVEQRISLDEPELIGEVDEAVSDQDFSSEDEGLTFRSRSLSTQLEPKSRMRSSSAASDLSSIPAPDHVTIAEIEPTTLKLNNEFDEDYQPDIVEPPLDSNPDYVPSAKNSTFYNSSSDEDSPVTHPTPSLKSEPPNSMPSPAHGFHPTAWEENVNDSHSFDYVSGKFDDDDDFDDFDQEIEDVNHKSYNNNKVQQQYKGVLKKTPSFDNNIASAGAVPSTAVGPTEERGRSSHRD